MNNILFFGSQHISGVLTNEKNNNVTMQTTSDDLTSYESSSQAVLITGKL